MPATKAQYQRRREATGFRRARHGVVAWLALFAMVLQALFAAEHVSAMAVSSAIGGPTGDPLGFLQICTANGVANLDDEDDGPQTPRGNGEPCVLCGSAAVSSAVQATMPAIVDAPLAPIAHSLSLPAEAPLLQRVACRAGTTRGPPVSTALPS